MTETLRPEETGTTPSQAPTEKTSVLSNILAIAGLIILVVVIIWGLVHLASLSKSWFTSLFPRSVPSIQMTAPASVTSGDPFSVRWSYSTKDKGSYALVYQCKTGLQFQTPGAGGAMNAIPCGAAFIVTPSTGNSISLTPYLSGTASTSVPLTMLFLPLATSSLQAQGTATIVVNPKASAEQVKTVTPVAPAPVSRSSGPADLMVRIISVSSDASGMASAAFDISNVGSGYSGGYYFTAQLPTAAYGQTYYGTPSQGTYTYTSPAQSSLGPGDHIVNTLRFSQAQSSGIFSVTVDPSNTVTDSNRTNNYAYQSLGTYYQAQPYYYNPQPYPYYTY